MILTYNLRRITFRRIIMVSEIDKKIVLNFKHVIQESMYHVVVKILTAQYCAVHLLLGSHCR